MNEVQESLDELNEGVIKNYSFDMLHNEIYLLVIVLEDGLEKKYDVTISNVSMYCYMNNTEPKRKNMDSIEDDDYLECTEINVISSNTKVSFQCGEEDEWLAQYSANVNLAIEIWNKLLLVEAQSIKINKEEFILY